MEISKGLSEAVNQERADNAVAKRQTIDKHGTRGSNIKNRVLSPATDSFAHNKAFSISQIRPPIVFVTLR
jgi:hypothetical protein